MALESFLTDDLTPALVQEVEQFLDSQQTGHIFQFPRWAGAGSRLMLWRENGAIRWAGTFGVQFPLGRKVPWIRALTATRGPVCDNFNLWQMAADEFAEKISRENFAYFEVSPDWPQGTEGVPLRILDSSKWKCSGMERVSLRLDLTRSEDQIFAGFRKNTRYEVRRAERLNATVRTASNEVEIDDFMSLYEDFAARKRFRAESHHEVRTLIGWLINTESRGALLLARADDRVCGGAVIARCGRRCSYIWGASHQQEDLNVGHILQWRALQWAKSHGCTEYDFGGYTPGATSGPAWFKAGFGGSVVHFTPPYRRVTRAGRYRISRLFSRTR